MVVGIIGSMGGKEEIKWLNENFPKQYFIKLPIAQIMARHGIGFDPKTEPDADQVMLAQTLAIKRDAAAAKWLLSNLETIKEKKIGSGAGLMRILSINRLPEADEHARKLLAAYRKVATPEAFKKPNDIDWLLLYETPWAIAHLHANHTEEENRPHFDGLLLHGSICHDITMLISADPLFWLEIFLGIHELSNTSNHFQIKEQSWFRPYVRAAFIKRDQEQFTQLNETLQSRLLNVSLKHKLFDDSSAQDIGYMLRECMGIDLSPLQASGVAAHYVQLRSTPKQGGLRCYTQAPWARMEWYPSLIGEHLGNPSSIIYEPSRLAPFDHELVSKALLEGKRHLECAVQSTLLWHRYINRNFTTPIECDMGGVHSVVVRLTGEYSAIGMHSLIRTVARRKGDQLVIGFQVDTQHVDKGGLASMIGQLNTLMEEYKADKGRKQISNPRWECNGKSGTLEYSSTSEAGLHFFKCTLPQDHSGDLHLYFDWLAPGEKQVLGHALYEPIFEP